MNDAKWTFAALGAGLALCGLVWMFVPGLQGAERTVEDLASRRLEVARRLMHQYDPGLARHAAILSDMRAAEIGFAEGDWSDDVDEEFQAVHESLWAAYQPMDWSQSRPSAAKASYGNVAGIARDGARSRDDLIEENERLLKDALAEVEAALAVGSGDAQGRTHAEANRLKGFIELHTGLAKARRAAILRGPALGLRRELRALGSTARQTAADQSLVSDSGVDGLIAEKEKERADAAAKRDERRAALDRLEGTIAELKGRIADAETRRSRAMEQMRSLRERGVDPGSPGAAESFAAAMRAADEAFRRADREAQSLTHGDFTSARIDASGDFLRGRYVENGSARNVAVTFGLLHHEGEHRVLLSEFQAAEAAVANAAEAVGVLKAQRESMTARESAARDLAAKAREAAEIALDELRRLESEAFDMEEEALNSLRRASGTLKQASSYANQWASSAREATSTMAPASLERSAFKARSESGWLGGFAAAEATDAMLASAGVHYARYEAARRDAALFADLADVLPDLDTEAVNAKLEESRQQGLEIINTAMADLEKAHRDTGKHWTLVAQAGNANYLLALFGDRSYATDAIDAYRKALQGREQEPYAAIIASRLRQLEEARQ